MLRKTKILALTLAIITMASYITGCGASDKAAGPAAVPAVTVEINEVKKESIATTLTFFGTARPLAEVNLVPKIGGRVERVNFKIGDSVKKGDCLIQLEQTDHANQLKQAEAALSAARANFNMLKTGQLPGQQAQTEANYQNAKANYDRVKQLYDEGAVSLQQYEAAELQYTVAKSQYDTMMATIPENLDAAQAQVKQAEAAYALAKSAYNNTMLTSPIDGIVSMIAFETGEMAGPGTPAATVVNIDSVVVDVNVSESKINSLRRGDELEVFVDSASDISFKGVISELSPAADPRTKTFPMKIEIKNDEHVIKGGMFATVKVASDKKDDVLAVPKDALVERGGEHFVFVADGDKAKMQKVTVGITGDDSVEITSGLEPGANIVTVGQDTLEDGDVIKVSDRGENR